ncbi:sodium:proton exchanger, partial [Fischerella thermalis WC542]
ASVIRPLNITDAALLHKPAIAMLLALVLVIVLATPTKQITQKAGWFLVGAYPVFLLAMFWL